MKVAVFIISLCLILLSGADRVLAGTHSRGCCYVRTYHHEMMPDGKRQVQQSDPAGISLAAISPEIDFFIIDGLDEEDADESLSRKFRQAGKFYELLFLQSILSQPDHFFKTPSSPFHQESDKYISQRVFRV